MHTQTRREVRSDNIDAICMMKESIVAAEYFLLYSKSLQPGGANVTCGDRRQDLANGISVTTGRVRSKFLVFKMDANL